MEKLKIAVIGVGNLGQHHAKWYKNIPAAELVGVYDIDQKKCATIAGNWDVIAFKNLSDLFERVDAVSVVVPTSSHYEVTAQLIEHRIHCLIEKPVTSTVDEAEQLRKMAETNNVILTVGHIERFNPAVSALSTYDIKPRFIEAHRLAAFDPRGTDVAVVLDLMIHDIELALHFIKSKVVKIDASAVSVISEKADIANARLTFENGAVANLTASRISLNQMRKLRIFQKSGYFSLDLASKRADIYQLADDSNPDGPGMTFPLGKSGKYVLYNKSGNTEIDMLNAELTAFISSVQNNNAPAVTIDEAIESLRIAIEIDKIGINKTIAE
ncbi:MAG: Gfo/Idh/MocA family oxidoreductase [Candidatus Zixiibacteriota bacterium]